ncbi:MAG TPA: xanthine dehydrogenase family protein molybdopterin-binding subunit [Nitrospira sp.]|nr:xanthine dehydrogenase family protein molybdopterin-binding subunit [Nitrospira sp.]
MHPINFNKLAAPTPSRREFLIGAAATAGVFVLGAYIPFPKRAFAQENSGMAKGIYDPNVFLKIGTDNTVTLLSKHFDMGQGAPTGLATLVAEELEADWSSMRIEFAPNNAKLYNNLAFGPVMGTGGSTSTTEAWEQMRQVGAAARMMFVTAAAKQWQVPAADITVRKGVLRHAASGKTATFGELADAAMRVPVPTDVPLKDPKAWTLIGTKLPRLDSLDKTTGKAVYALDIRRPGMLTAVIKHPELFGARVASFDPTETMKIVGVVDVVQIPTGVAVLAKDTWSAIRGRNMLKVTWETSQAETRSTTDIFDEYRALAGKPGVQALRRGDATAGLKHAVKTVEAEFTMPYLTHAPMEPLNATLELRSDGAEMWSGCQLKTLDEATLANILELKPEQIKIHTLYGGGSFGRRGSFSQPGNPVGDWIIELAEIVKTIKGRAPVHLLWTREDDIKGGFYRPMALHKVTAGIDAKGHIAGWQHATVSKSIIMGTAFEPMAVKDGVDATAVEGIADTPYAINALSVDWHNVKTPVPVLWMRSVGHSHTAFVMETILDDLAHLAKKDPLNFRLDLLAQQPRDAAVVKLAAEKSGWTYALPNGHGRGLAYHRSFNTRVAMVAEVSVKGKAITVDRIVAAVDCGIAVNPDVIEAQIQGAIGFTLSAVLRNQITLNKGVVEQNNFYDYEPTRMPEMPKVEVHIVKSAERPTGIGEPGVPPVAPSIGNAIFAATGKRLRHLPLTL